MVQQITKGIKVTVKTVYNGVFHREDQLFYAFSYAVTVENNSKEPVQLLARHWEIFDSLNQIEIVDGEGVVGETPTIAPQKSYTYSSNCFLNSTAGSMKGFYKMITVNSQKKFNVHIPTFQLTTSALSN